MGSNSESYIWHYFNYWDWSYYCVHFSIQIFNLHAVEIVIVAGVLNMGRKRSKWWWWWQKKQYICWYRSKIRKVRKMLNLFISHTYSPFSWEVFIVLPAKKTCASLVLLAYVSHCLSSSVRGNSDCMATQAACVCVSVGVESNNCF